MDTITTALELLSEEDQQLMRGYLEIATRTLREIATSSSCCSNSLRKRLETEADRAEVIAYELRTKDELGS